MDERIYLTIISTITLVLMAVLVINLLLIARNRRVKHQTALLEAKAAYERDLLSTRLEVTETTLAEVSADLHDDVGQMLALAIMKLNQFEEAGEAKAAVRAGLESVRAISKTLSPDYFQSVGFNEALNRMIDRVHKSGNVQINLHADDTIPWTDQNRALYVFRILQELVTNTVKHAQASQVNIHIGQQANTIQIAYADNGIGFEADSTAEKSGQGLVNVPRRVAVLNGTILIKTTPGNGFVAEMQFPMS